MDYFEAIEIVEGFEPGEDLLAWSHLIETGIVWKLQGSLQRYASLLIEQGLLDWDGALTDLGLETAGL